MSIPINLPKRIWVSKGIGDQLRKGPSMSCKQTITVVPFTALSSNKKVLCLHEGEHAQNSTLDWIENDFHKEWLSDDQTCIQRLKQLDDASEVLNTRLLGSHHGTQRAKQYLKHAAKVPGGLPWCMEHSWLLVEIQIFWFHSHHCHGLIQ